MSVDFESLVIGGQEVNDEGPFLMRALTNNPPAKRVDWLTSPDADGAIPAMIPRSERMTIEAELEMVEQASMDDALDWLGTLLDKLGECESLLPGQPVTRTPANSDRTRLTYAMVGEVTNLPVTNEGDLQGWLQARPVVQIRLECWPFWLGTLVAGTPVTATTPLLTADVSPEGDVPALGIVRLTEGASQDRSHVEFACDHTTDTARAYLIDSDDLVTSGYSGAGATRTGAYDPDATGNSVVRATLATAPVVVCATGEIDLVGTFKVKVRAYGAGSGTISVRVDHRDGDGPFTEGSWVELPGLDAFYELPASDLYAWVADFTEAELGTQSGEIRIVAKSTVGGDTLDVDYLETLPQVGFYGVARAPLVTEVADALDAWTGFGTESGAISGDTLDDGTNTWATAGSTGDFSAGSGVATRATTSDANPRFAVTGSAVATQAVQADAQFSATPSVRLGLTGRYIDTSNYAFVWLDPSGGTVSFRTVVSGAAVRTESISSVYWTNTSITYTLKLTIAANGAWGVYLGINGSADFLILSGQAAELQAGGALATGKVGLYDYNSSATACTRTYDNVAAWAATQDRALFADEDFELHYDRALRESSAGGTWGKPPVYRGGYALIPPAGDDALTARIVAKARRNDVDGGLPDSTIDDSLTLAVDHIPRYAVPR